MLRPVSRTATLVLIAAFGGGAIALARLTAQTPQPRDFPVLPLDRLIPISEAIESRLDHVPGEVLVKFRQNATIEAQTAALQAIGSRESPRDLRRIGDVMILRDPARRDARTLAAALSANPDVEYAEPNYLGRPHDVPNDTNFVARQWNLQQMKMPAAWNIAPGGTPDVVVAIIDSGITAVPSQALSARTWNGSAIVTISVPVAPSPDFTPGRFTNPADFTISESSPSSFVVDSDGHGTHTGSTVGEDTNNGFGLAGIAYNAMIMPLKVCITYWDRQFSRSAANIPGFEPPAPATCATSAVVAAIRYAADRGAQVINMSLGGFPQSNSLFNALDYAVDRGVFVAISNGNSFEDGNETSYPAAFAPQFDGVMSVAAVTRNNQHAWYSTTNAQTEIAAYGGDRRAGVANGVWQMTINQDDSDPETVVFPRFDRYREESFQGTSMAAPHVAGLAALLHSRGIRSPAAKEAHLIATALDILSRGKDNESGHGLVQGFAALYGFGIRR